MIELPAPASYVMFQSQADAEQLVSKPFVVSHTYWPPVTQWFAFAESTRNGAMKRNVGSHGLGV